MKVQARPVLNLPEDVQTAEGWRDALAGLARQEAEMEAGLEAVRAERRELALSIARGEPAATKRNTELNARQVELLNDMDLLLVVRSAAQEKLAVAEAVEAAAVAEARRAEARGIAGELLEQSRRADAAMREAAEALAERTALARRLSGYGVGLPGLMNRTRLAGAAGQAGLAEQLEVRRSPRQLHAPLAEMDRKILAGVLGGAPPEAVDPRVIPGQLGAFTVAPPPAPAEFDPTVRW